MSQQNVEVAKLVIDAFNRRDVEGFIALVASDFEWFPAMAGTVKGRGYRGRDGIEKYLVEIGDAWEEYRVLVEEFRDLDDRVVMLGRIEGRGRGSRAWIDSPTGTIFVFCNGKTSSVRTFLDHGEALRAAGLEG
ncbi:MAG TPA: nuclear transport factor 2 family protein [Solirubrobacteraceae bacterium]|nr:nuclear transport factor 2 family protein [Solirubrobacteraceae bacterium]